MKKYEKRICIYKKILVGLLVVGIFMIPSYWYYDIYARVPGTIRLRAGQEESIDLQVPVSGVVYQKTEEKVVAASAIPADSISVSLDKPVKITSVNANEYQMDLKLLGIIPFKNVNLHVVQEREIIPAGIPIGIYVKTEGVLVIDTGKFKDVEGNWQQPAEHILKSGDYIEAVNDKEVTSKKEFVEELEKSDGEELILRILRQEESMDVKIKPQKNGSGEFKVGIWIRDSAQGIGTLTYIDKNHQFGALGHGINDIDTSELMEVKGGTLYQTRILDITPGKSGTPGEITGMIQYNEENIMGSIQKNTTQGIFGAVNEQMEEQIGQESFPIGLKQDIEIGPAQIICTIGTERKFYDVRISRLDYIAENTNRGILLEVTDAELLSETGGIIQGMSGAPIIQNGKIIGAVTHVLVQNPTKGYGIFIENMLETSDN